MKPDDIDDITLRDWFAGLTFGAAIEEAKKTTEGDLGRMFGKDQVDIRREAIAAALAYRYADELIARRNSK